VLLLGVLTLWVATVPLLGGRVGHLSSISFRRKWAALSAVALQVLILRVFPEGSPDLHAIAHLASYALIFTFVGANLHVPGLPLLAFGGLLNLLAIAANQGVMPADPDALRAAGILAVPGEFSNSAVMAQAHLWFLGDVFAIPAGWPMSNVFSVGDVVLVLGAFVLLHRVCRSRLAPGLDALAAWGWRTAGRVEIVRDNAAFRRLWTAQAVSGVGDWVFPPAVYAALVGGRARASDLALLLIAQIGPGVVVGLVGGPFIDRFSRKWLMVASDVVRGVAVLSLLIGDEPSLGHVYAVSLVLGVGNALFQPALLAAIPNVVPRAQLASANALVGLTQSLAVMVGFPLGGYMVDQLGTGWGFALNAFSFAISAALIARTVVPDGIRTTTQRLIDGLAEGFRYVRRNAVARRVILVVAMITLAAGIKSPLEPLFALDSLDAGATGVGTLGAIWGAGMIVGSLVATWADRRFGHAALLAGSAGTVAIAVILASLSPALLPVALLWLPAGVANATGTVAYETLLQERTDDAVRGRVMAALEAAVQAGLLAGVGIAALTDVVFAGPDAARAGLMLSGGAFGAAGIAAWALLVRRSQPEPGWAAGVRATYTAPTR
jgi:predicted MFS family arabinose efflux permease